MRNLTTVAACGTAILALTLSACSSKASSSGSENTGDLQTDTGVTDTEIHLLEIEDLTGPFKVQSLAYTYGIRIWAEEVNADGGICDRDIVINLQDSNYKPDNALPIYEQQKANTVGMVSLVGSPILAALKQKLTADNFLTIPGSWASVNLDSPAVMMIGQTYDVEMINGLAYAMEQDLLSDGDKIAHIYVDSEYGQNGFLGTQAFAKEHDLTVVDSAISASDTDMTATITKLKSEGVTLIALSVPPAATASVALQNVAQGLNAPMVGSNPTFAPPMLAEPAVEAALDNFYLVQSTAPVAADIPKAKELLEKYKAATQDPPNIGVNMSYVWGLAYGEVLKAACEAGDMTRAGLLTARDTVDSVDTQGLAGDQDLSVVGGPSSRTAFILKADSSVDGALVTEEAEYSSQDAKDYKAPFQK